ncbi:MAG: threonine dehydratase [Richelia sp. RM2_1_2]|nr:threonine dehydratase [Richelia sp. SM2_1_7]NJM19535.1 threonine dehydratase [Richelia sp. SM1_7_0]NJN08745.1 threonine dehydratase [Richelia sp. RM1_1_1]NJO27670.1 threonine dehydratase [Richelia sp. SL_2_1]NJO59275.1 threonine dehydratase [Richelia sp. RM2_1_2]
MQRLRQIFQNSLIRFIAVFSVLFRSIFGFFRSIFGSIGKNLGISNSESGYFVDADEKKAIEETKIPVATVKSPEPTISSNRRRPNKSSNMDDFMKMAKEINQG